MKVFDPVPRRTPRLSCGPRSCACGCGLWLVFSAIGLPALLGWLISGEPVPSFHSDRDQARELQRKIDTLGRFYDPTTILRSETMPTIRLTEPEINAYVADLRDRLQPPGRDALQSGQVRLEDGRFLIQASIDLNRLGGSIVRALPWPYHWSPRVELSGRLEWFEGKGRLTLDVVRAGAIQVSGVRALDWLVWFYPPARPRIELMKGFPLPFGTRSIAVRPGEVVIEGGQ
jgi:hypothetical protein